MTIDVLLDDFAVRSFRDVADADYIVARMACRSALITQYLWASQQAIEKYLKCILLLNRVPARGVRHDLQAALLEINSSRRPALDLTKRTEEFIAYLDAYGRFRYLEISNYALTTDLVTLDRAVWEVRRYCASRDLPPTVKLQHRVSPPKVRLVGGYLERIIDDAKSPAREPLLWQNAFFGKRTRKTVRVTGRFHAVNSPLSLHPQILDEVLKYVYLPKEVQDAYRSISRPGATSPDRRH